MKFCEKLVKLREDNEYSQEQLASTLGVTILEISKWEEGAKIPGNSMMLKICETFYCELKDLTDDAKENEEYTNGTNGIGKNVISQHENVSDLDRGLKTISRFINKSCTMFKDMDFNKRILCVCEVVISFVILLIISLVLHNTVFNFMNNLIGNTTIGARITSITSSILSFALRIMGLLIWIKLYKIRYLDNFITQEDLIESKKNREYFDKEGSKTFVSKVLEIFKPTGVIGKFTLLILKIICTIFVLPMLLLFVFVIGVIVISIYHIQFGVLFLWLAILLIGINVLIYGFIEMGYNFITSEMQDLSKIFGIAIAGLVIIGIGIGLSISTYLGFEAVDTFADNEYQSEIINIPMATRIILNTLPISEISIDNELDNIKLEIQYINNIQFSLRHETILGFREHHLDQKFKYLEMYKLVLNDLSNGQIRDYTLAEYARVIVTTSQDNFSQLQKNYEQLNSAEGSRTNPSIVEPPLVR
jgi:transcriptional regulator with XRE-family HTH domain